MTDCPECHGELVECVDDDPKEHGHGYQPTKAYWFCASCGRSYPHGFDAQEEA